MYFNGFVSSKIYDKRHDTDFDIVNIPFLYILPLTWFTFLKSFDL